MRLWQAAIPTVGLLLLSTVARAHDTDHCVAGNPQPVFSVEAGSGEDTEGVAVAPNGDVFTAEAYSGRIHRIKPDGKAEVFAELFEPGEYSSVWVLGMAFGPDRNLYVLANTWDASTHGVWRVYPDGFAELAAAIPFPPDGGSALNGLTFDDGGNLFVTDSLRGAIWKVSRRGVVELWLTSDLLIWRDDPTGPFGANGIAYRHGTLFVAVTDAGAGLLPEVRGRNYPLVSIRVQHDGSPGLPHVFLTDILVPDGLTFDDAGNLYVVDFGGLAWGPGFPLAGPARLLRVRPDGTEEVVASAGLENSASVAIRGQTAYVTNLYVQHAPNVVKIDLCTRHPQRR
jgi:sugar lactone lactonase YvrE